MPAGGSFAQEAIVELRAGEMPDELREWRRVQGRFGARLRGDLNGAAHSPCR
jgi:hypothetical protein